MRKISKDGLLLCKLQTEVFEKSIDKMETSSEIFIRRFMKSMEFQTMDQLNIVVMKYIGLGIFIGILHILMKCFQHKCIK